MNTPVDVALPRARHARRVGAVAAATARPPVARALGAAFGALVVVVAVVAVLVMVPALREHAPSAAPPPGEAATPPPRAVPVASSGSGARSILHRWDAARAHAWSTGDLRALADLYTPRSLAGRADVAMLHRWRARGLVVTGLHMQVRALDVVARSPARLVLHVVDRETGAVARTPRGVIVLPRDRPTRHTIRLERHSDGPWRVATVT